MNRLLALLSLVAALLPAVAPADTPTDTPAPVVRVLAASSLTNVLDELGATWTKQGGPPVRFSYAASSTLARQLEAGAQADLFASADEEWMDYVQQRRLIDAASRFNLLGNRLVLVAPKDSPLELRIAPRFALAAALGDGRLSIGDPDAVPAGRYARAALTTLQVWDTVATRIVRAENVRSALAFVDRGEAPLGIVYATDAQIDPAVRVVDTFPADTHPPILYPVALTAGASPQAARFLAFLKSQAAQAVFRRYGFIAPP
jgi:molybdate transport system substrate-binding protein